MVTGTAVSLLGVVRDVPPLSVFVTFVGYCLKNIQVVSDPGTLLCLSSWSIRLYFFCC